MADVFGNVHQLLKSVLVHAVTDVSSPTDYFEVHTCADMTTDPGAIKCVYNFLLLTMQNYFKY